ncbi:MAG: lytic murein transglycosylase B [Steroidobacteraceae bacterium]
MPVNSSLRSRIALLGCVLAGLVSTSAQAINVQRTDVRAFIDRMVATNQFDRAELEAVLSKAETKQSILDAISKPAEKTVPWFEYRERFLIDKRINRGKAFQAEHRAMLDKLAAQGAPVAEILGILGVETQYGEITGRFRVLDALATLGFDYAPRSDFFLMELEQFLLMCRELKLDYTAPLGSYAGAMGPPQFMPHSYREFAVDGDGDGKRDLWNNWDDVLASVANYLAKYGWRSGEPVVADAELASSDTSEFSIGDVTLNETVGSLKAKGVRFSTSLPDSAPAVLLALRGKTGTVYRVGFNNFYVITRYNRSPLYANTVYDLGQAITPTATTK